MSKPLQANNLDTGLHPDFPLNLQIYSLLRQEIEDGIWEGRTDFPGEADLAERYGVSVITSRNALDRLSRENFIQRGRGRRTVVLPARKAMNQSSELMMPATGEKVFAYKLLYAGIGIAPAEACEAYGLPSGSEMWLCRRLRRFNGRPHSVTLNVQRPEVGSQHTKKALSTLPMADSLRSMGQNLTEMKRRVGVDFPPPDVAQHLEITMQDPTLVYTFILLDESAPVEWVRIYVHPKEQQHWETFDIKIEENERNAKI